MNERHFETHEPVALYVENGRGQVHVVATETTESTVRVTGQEADDVDIDFSGGRLVVVAPQRRGGWLAGENRLEMSITVPTGSSLSTKLGSSDLDVRGELSEATVKSGSGDVSLETLTAASRVETGSGDVVLGTAAALQVKSGSGDVRLGEVRAGLEASTGSGDVQIRACHAEAVVKTGSGDLQVGSSDGDLTFSTGSGDLTVDSAGAGRVTVKGASSDVHLGVPAGTPVWTDISTVSGRIRSALQSSGQPQDGADHLEVRARTVSGDITLVEA